MRTPSTPLRLVLAANRHQHNDGQGRVNYEVALAALNRGMKVTLLTAYCADEIAIILTLSSFPSEKAPPTQLLRNLAFASESARWLREHRGSSTCAGQWIYNLGALRHRHCTFRPHLICQEPLLPICPVTAPLRSVSTSLHSFERPLGTAGFSTAKHIIAVSDMVAEDVHQLGVPWDRIGGL